MHSWIPGEDWVKNPDLRYDIPCPVCGGLIENRETHYVWHINIAELVGKTPLLKEQGLDAQRIRLAKEQCMALLRPLQFWQRGVVLLYLNNNLTTLTNNFDDDDTDLDPLERHNMSGSAYPVDPMTAFFAAVTAIENGSVGEIDLDFNLSTHDTEVTMSISIRREARTFTTIRDVEQKEGE